MPIEMNCVGCGGQFYCYESEAEKGRKYCSRGCKGRANGTRPSTADSRTPIDFTCQFCGTPFVMMKSYVTAYRKKFDRDPLYCSMKCSAAGQRRNTEARSTFTCVNCGKEGTKTRKPGGGIYMQQRICSKQCKREWTSKIYRAKHGTPQVSRRIKRGYVVLRFPPQNGEPPKEVLEHRYVMEQFLGRPLRDNETVHHKHSDKTTNTLDNLELRTGNHGPGQLVTDQIAFAIRVFQDYPEFARAAGYELTAVHD